MQVPDEAVEVIESGRLAHLVTVGADGVGCAGAVTFSVWAFPTGVPPEDQAKS